MGSGSAVVYCDFHDAGSELFSIDDGGEIDRRGEYVKAGAVYIIVETGGKCKNGSFKVQSGVRGPLPWFRLFKIL